MPIDSIDRLRAYLSSPQTQDKIVTYCVYGLYAPVVSGLAATCTLPTAALGHYALEKFDAWYGSSRASKAADVKYFLGNRYTLGRACNVQFVGTAVYLPVLMFSRLEYEPPNQLKVAAGYKQPDRSRVVDFLTGAAQNAGICGLGSYLTRSGNPRYALALGAVGYAGTEVLFESVSRLYHLCLKAQNASALNADPVARPERPNNRP